MSTYTISSTSQVSIISFESKKSEQHKIQIKKYKLNTSKLGLQFFLLDIAYRIFKTFIIFHPSECQSTTLISHTSLMFDYNEQSHLTLSYKHGCFIPYNSSCPLSDFKRTTKLVTARKRPAAFVYFFCKVSLKLTIHIHVK